MLGFLFRGLTAEPARGAALFDALTGEARRPHWYLEGGVPDTLDGRFAMLTTVLALALVRLEDGDVGNALSVGVTERFIEVMKSEHREFGLGDPALGRTVRKLVGVLAKRTEQWRDADASSWSATARASVYKDEPAPAALEHSAAALKHLADRLAAASLEQLAQGRIA